MTQTINSLEDVLADARMIYLIHPRQTFVTAKSILILNLNAVTVLVPPQRMQSHQSHLRKSIIRTLHSHSHSNNNRHRCLTMSVQFHQCHKQYRRKQNGHLCQYTQPIHAQIGCLHRDHPRHYIHSNNNNQHNHNLLRALH